MVCKKRVQINVYIASGPYLTPDPELADDDPSKTKWLQGVTPVALPVMWYGEYAMIRDDKADEFTTYYLAEDAIIACYVLGAVGAAVSLVAAGIVLGRRRQARKQAEEIVMMGDTTDDGALTKGLLSPITFF